MEINIRKLNEIYDNLLARAEDDKPLLEDNKKLRTFQLSFKK